MSRAGRRGSSGRRRLTCTPPDRSKFVLKFGAKAFEKLDKIGARHDESHSKIIFLISLFMIMEKVKFMSGAK